VHVSRREETQYSRGRNTFLSPVSIFSSSFLSTSMMSRFTRYLALVSTLSAVAAHPYLENDFGESVFARANNESKSDNRKCHTNNGLLASSFHPPLYTEYDRPQIHFSPSSGFMNDPNGLVKSGDTWHMYFQYNPTAMVAGNQHWGHATSKDLYTWNNHPPAISPDGDGQGIFSGSAVLDVNNTSGFFDNSTEPDHRFIAIYTLNTDTEQNQNIAYSSDGYNYTKYEGNPVITLNTTQFRDPKVFFDEGTSQWIMTVSHPQAYQIGFYASADLKTWTELSRFGPAGLLGFQYECPDLVQVPVQGGAKDGQMVWVLIVSVNPGMPLGGSAVQYFIGDWNGTEFTAQDAVARIADFGKDWYAAQTWYNAPAGKTIGIGWASNWEYTNVAPTSPYRSIMSTPRELKLIWSQLNPMKWGYQLAQLPYDLTSLSPETLAETTTSENKTVSLQGNGAFEIKANFSLSYNASINATYPTGEFKIYDTTNSGYLKVGFTFGDPISAYIDRRFAGRSFGDNNPYFTDRFSQQLAPLYRTPNDTTSDQLMEMRIVVDRTVTEVFLQHGIASSVVLTYWDDESRPAKVSVGLGEADTIKLDSLKVEAIHSTWPNCP
jgi:beta-fructofuranosidase